MLPWHLYFHMVLLSLPVWAAIFTVFAFLLCSECHHVPWALLGCLSMGVMQLDCNWAAANPQELVGIPCENGSEQTHGQLFPLIGNSLVLIWTIIHAMTHTKDIGADASPQQLQIPGRIILYIMWDYRQTISDHFLLNFPMKIRPLFFFFGWVFIKKDN